MSNKWKVLHLVLNTGRDMSSVEIHKKVIKNRGTVSISTIRRWRNKVRSGETVRPRFDTLQTVLSAISDQSFGIVDSNNKVIINFSQKQSTTPKRIKTSKNYSYTIRGN